MSGSFRPRGRSDWDTSPPNGDFAGSSDPLDVTLLAEMDEHHGTLSGPATKKLMERACEIYGDKRYETLSRISVTHLYNLRGGRDYVSKRRHWTKTRSTRKPRSENGAHPARNGRQDTSGSTA